jgi:hypothetical protein
MFRASGPRRLLMGLGFVTVSLLLIAYLIVDAIGLGFLTLRPSLVFLALGFAR